MTRKKNAAMLGTTWRERFDICPPLRARTEDGCRNEELDSTRLFLVRHRPCPTVRHVALARRSTMGSSTFRATIGEDQEEGFKSFRGCWSRVTAWIATSGQPALSAAHET